MIEITINGEVFKAKTYDCHLISVDMGDKVQTQDGVNHVQGRKLKRYISFGFSDLSRSETHRLIQALYSNRYLDVTYFDTYTNVHRTGIFILQNDPSAPVKIWRKIQYFNGISVELMEKGAT